MMGASVADAQTLSDCPNCTYIPSTLHRSGILYGVGLPADAAIAYIGYELKRGGHRWWFVPAVAMTVAHSYLAYHWAHSTN
jgi:hypothetical protein